MYLSEILNKINTIKIKGKTNLHINGMHFDSRMIKDKFIFFAVNGTNTDGHHYIESSIKNGAVVVVTDSNQKEYNDQVTYIYVKNVKKSLALMAANFYQNPSKKIKLIGVTGTNGKTTVVNLLYNLFTSLGVKCGMISTIKNIVADKTIPSTHTTPDSLTINYLLRKMLDHDCRYCFMEVSSHAIDQNRIYGLQFSLGIFTNITHDHLDYHKTFKEYFSVKKSFFSSLKKNAYAIINIDDNQSKFIINDLKCKVHTYSLKSKASYMCKILEMHLDYMSLDINKLNSNFSIVGKFNAYNILSAFAVAHHYKFKALEILKSLSSLKSAEGRFQHFKSKNNTHIIIDYAHTPDALNNVLSTINELSKHHNKLITVFGCGGERDKEKRPIMTKIAHDLSTHVIVTSDNPRSEDPEEIIKQMLSGLDTNDYVPIIIKNRKKAIREGYLMLEENDIMLIAGKGHENYQEINKTRIPFSDIHEVKQLINLK